MTLKITEIRVETVQSIFEWTFVRIYAGDLYGIGEANPTPGLKGIEEALGKLLVGEDALKINRIEEKLRHASLCAGTSFYHLISAVNMALHDLVGKHVNLPVWRLLGGDRERVKVYVDTHAGESFEMINSLLMPVRFPNPAGDIFGKPEIGGHPIMGRLAEEKWNDNYTPESYAKRARQMVGEGYTAIKFDLDIPTPYTKPENVRSGEVSLKEADYMGEIVKALRAEVGDDVDLMIDLHWRYNLNSALRIIKALESYRLRWIEDLTPAQRAINNLEEFSFLSSRCTIPIATGENMYTVYQFKDLLNTGVTVWTPDIGMAGGITEGRRIAELASMYDIEFSPHNIGTPIETMATAHVASIANTFGVLEYHAHDFPIWKEMAKAKRPVIEEGFVNLTEEPGLGVDLDDRVMKKYWPEFDL